MKRLAIVVLLIGLYSAAFAEYFVIENYSVEAEVFSDKTVLITETLRVDFNTLRHGIFRNIPFRQLDFSAQSNIMSIFTPSHQVIMLWDWSVDGWKYKISRSGDDIVVKIGDKNTFVDGLQEYVIQYKVYGAINPLAGGEEFYWNLIGTEWDTDILNADFTVVLPGASEEDISYLAYRGEYGATEQLESLSLNAGKINGFISEPLKPLEGVTVKIDFPENYFAEPSGWMRFRYFLALNSIPPIALILPILVLILAVILWAFFGKDDKFIKVTEFFPPKGMTSAEAGKLIDGRTDNRDLVSLIYFWAVNGSLMIREGKNHKGKDDIFLRKIGSLKGKRNHEKKIYQALFARKNKNNEVPLSSLKKSSRFGKALYSAKRILDSEWEKAPYYHPVSMKIYRFLDVFLRFGVVAGWFVILLVTESLGIAVTFRNDLIVYGIMTIMFSLIHMLVVGTFREGRSLLSKAVLGLLSFVLLTGIMGGAYFGILLKISMNLSWVPYVLISNIIIYMILVILKKIIPKKLDKGLAKYKILTGFKEFIERAEEPKLKALIAENPRYFDETLPFAIAFGLAEKWVDKFEGLIPAELSWYQSEKPSAGHKFNFKKSLVKSLNNIDRVAVPQAPPSESGGSSGYSGGSSGHYGGGSSSSSSGGGYSGGGSGGGGGGSW